MLLMAERNKLFVLGRLLMVIVAFQILRHLLDSWVVS
jgi:hypothetical protein